MNKSKQLTLEDKAYIRQHIEIDKPLPEIAEALNKSVWQVKNYIRTLPEEMLPKSLQQVGKELFELTDADKEKIRNMIFTHSLIEIAKDISKGKERIFKYVKTLPEWEQAKAIRRNALTDSDKEYCRSRIGKITLQQMADNLEKSKSTIYAYLCVLPEWIAHTREKEVPVVHESAPTEKNFWPAIYSNNYGGKAPALNTWSNNTNLLTA